MTTQLNRWEAPLLGGAGSSPGGESAAMSAQTERGESLPEKEPGQTRRKREPLVPNTETRDRG